MPSPYNESASRIITSGGSIVKKTVLLVEDSKFLRLTNQRELAQAGFNVIAAGDGEEAIRVALEQLPDVILLDMLLPRLSGPEVLQALKRDPITCSIPVIVLSGLSQRNEDKLMKDGAVAYFEKSRLDKREGFNLLSDTIRNVTEVTERRI